MQVNLDAIGFVGKRLRRTGSWEEGYENKKIVNVYLQTDVINCHYVFYACISQHMNKPVSNLLITHWSLFCHFTTILLIVASKIEWKWIRVTFHTPKLDTPFSLLSKICIRSVSVHPVEWLHQLRYTCIATCWSALFCPARKRIFRVKNFPRHVHRISSILPFTVFNKLEKTMLKLRIFI